MTRSGTNVFKQWNLSEAVEAVLTRKPISSNATKTACIAISPSTSKMRDVPVGSLSLTIDRTIEAIRKSPRGWGLAIAARKS
jgi:hypothetical protein